jgi:hypothetical protein
MNRLVILLMALLNTFPSLVLIGILSGCAVLSMAMEVALDSQLIPNPDSMQTESNHKAYEPQVLTSNKDMIRIKYLAVSPNAEHEKVMEMINDHCDGSYIELYRVTEIGYDTVEAECTHDTDS